MLDPTRRPVEFLTGPQPLEADGACGSAHLGLSTSNHSSDAAASQESEHPSTDELLHFLDSLTSASTSTVTGPTSPSLSAQHTPVPSVQQYPPASIEQEALASLYDSASSLLTDISLHQQNAPAQAKPQHLNPSFTTNAKAFDAGDIAMPFDLSLPVFDTIAYPMLSMSAGQPLIADTTPHFDPVAFDATLDSPLDLSSSQSQDTSPWSDVLASPMFSLPSSAPTSGRVPETPLPPLEPSFAMSEAAAALPLFPPLPTPPVAAATALRPLPPLPVRPTAAPLQQGSPVISMSSSSSLDTSSLPTPRSSESCKRPEPNGFRTTIPLLGLEAPIQTRNPVLASSTSRKRKTAGAEKALAKRARATEPSQTPRDASPSLMVAEPANPDELPADIVAAIERKRLQNTMSARKSRARKQAKLQELEDENKLLMDENKLLMDENAKLRAQLEAVLSGRVLPQPF
ncbi:bZIP transcription factor [Sporobolomyces koalae]|uniref:bZIP transcription factor n=1 Tax=Sporobolomyces koalae TaxID=500713 RepID=UPI00317538C2